MLTLQGDFRTTVLHSEQFVLLAACFFLLALLRCCCYFPPIFLHKIWSYPNNLAGIQIKTNFEMGTTCSSFAANLLCFCAAEHIQKLAIAQYDWWHGASVDSQTFIASV